MFTDTSCMIHHAMAFLESMTNTFCLSPYRILLIGPYNPWSKLLCRFWDNQFCVVVFYGSKPQILSYKKNGKNFRRQAHSIYLINIILFVWAVEQYSDIRQTSPKATIWLRRPKNGHICKNSTLIVLTHQITFFYYVYVRK